MITYYFRTIQDEALKELTEARSGVWAHAVNPNKEELAQLTKDLFLDEDILADATDFYEVPRMERSSGATYFFTRYPISGEAEHVTAPLLIITGESFVATISPREIPQLQRFISGQVAVFTTQKAKFFIQIMEVLTVSFDRELVRLRKAVHKDRVRLSSIGPKEIERLVSYENMLNGMVDALIPTNTWLQQVPKGNYMQLYDDDVETMEDLVIANGQVVNSARSILKMIQNIRGASEAIMTSRLNNTLRILTILTIFLTVPLVITSMYGMNVHLPLQDSPFAFLLIMGFNLLLLVGLAFVFRKNNWF